MPLATTPEQIELLKKMRDGQRENADWFVAHKKNHFTAADYRAKADALTNAIEDIARLQGLED